MGLYSITVTGDYPYDDLDNLMPIRSLLKGLLTEHGYSVSKLALYTVRIQTELAKLLVPAHFFIYPDKVTQKDGQYYAAVANIAVNMIDSRSGKTCFFTISTAPTLAANASTSESKAKPLYYGITKELDVTAARVLLALRGDLPEHEIAELEHYRAANRDVLNAIVSEIDTRHTDLLNGQGEWSQELERLIARLLLHICPIEDLHMAGNFPPLSIAKEWFSDYPLDGEFSTTCQQALSLV